MNELQKKTLELIRSLEDNDWLIYCGTAPNVMDIGKYLFVTKSKAIDLLLSREWDDVLIDARNGCSAKLPQTELASWNERVATINDAIMIACEAGERAIRSHFLSDDHDIKDRIRSIIRGACVELEYPQYLSVGFFNEICHIIRLGRLPCGLTAEFPNGKLIVY